ncbi:hypothetical protein LINGRAHAP2_LOCUS35539 [Linum grandiflorum]
MVEFRAIFGAPSSLLVSYLNRHQNCSSAWQWHARAMGFLLASLFWAGGGDAYNIDEEESRNVNSRTIFVFKGFGIQIDSTSPWDCLLRPAFVLYTTRG